MIKNLAPRSAYTAQTDSALAAAELIAGLGEATPKLVVFFATVEQDGTLIGNALRIRFPYVIHHTFEKHTT